MTAGQPAGPARKPLPKCPNCNSVVPPGRAACISCGMDVAKMDEYRRAAAMALKAGRGRAAVEEASDEPKPQAKWVRPAKIGGAAAAGLVALMVVYSCAHSVFVKPEPWRSLPADPQEAVKTYVSLVGTDTNADFNRAYDLIAPEFKHAQNDSDRDVYLNFHHQVWRYLKEITLDETWAASATIVPGAAGDKFEVMVGPERLTVQVVDMSPKELQDKGEHHWAVSHFLEPDPYADYFYKASQLEGTKALGGLSGAGPGLGKILDEITAMGSAARMSLWEAKITRLPLLNRPKGEGIDFHIIDLWRFRTDPVVRFMLERVVSGDDYKPSSKERAKAVLDGTLSEEERAVRGLE